MKPAGDQRLSPTAREMIMVVTNASEVGLNSHRIVSLDFCFGRYFLERVAWEDSMAHSGLLRPEDRAISYQQARRQAPTEASIAPASNEP